MCELATGRAGNNVKLGHDSSWSVGSGSPSVHSPACIKHNVLPTDLEQSRQDVERTGLFIGGEGQLPGTDGVLGTMPSKRVMFSIE